MAQSGRLGSIVHGTRTSPPPSAPSPPAAASSDDDEDKEHWAITVLGAFATDDDDCHHCDCDDDSESVDVELLGAAILVGGAIFVTGVTSPVWVPHTITEDDFARPGYFAHCPYQNGYGYMSFAPITCEDQIKPELWEEYGGDIDCIPSPNQVPVGAKTWAARFRVDYTDDFHDMQKIGGHLLLSTSSRFGLDTEMSFFEERRSDGGRDQLWLGDCNLIWRFAQSERTQWRAGVGFNWLDDPIDTNFGFNFTYGVDFFPADPFVASAELDWGTLGHASLFHFRTTVGVVVHGMEAYTGYEYYDIDHTQINSLIGGVRIWF